LHGTKVMQDKFGIRAESTKDKGVDMIKPGNDPKRISRLVIRGYKSIVDSDVELGSINLLIGANGAGKSNFVGFFRLLAQVLEGQLQIATGRAGGPDSILHFGRKKTERMEASVYFGALRYAFTLAPTSDNRLIFEEELIANTQGKEVFSSGHFESQASGYSSSASGKSLDAIITAMKGWKIYHFHDTGNSARVKQVHGINDNQFLSDDARNLAAFLLRLKLHHEKHYGRIVEAIRLVAPFFGDFLLRPTFHNPEKIQLEWTERGQSEPFMASALSDGTLRFICLATALLQPEQFMPGVILIDEPELGLHPFAISVLAGLIRFASQRQQLIIATQSVEVVNQFEIQNLIVVDRYAGSSTFKRLDRADLSDWLEDYDLGDLWNKNLLGGRP